jgi:hypothetical protein
MNEWLVGKVLEAGILRVFQTANQHLGQEDHKKKNQDSL